ncbi:MAG: prepilin-type N-terminal cleavage/methylation domain-containing protein [Candidatus Omnitrophica bacterium]|nr:prepilin-type N-terminal cleavage/methylation domain-containing protein [Candidatus Omnitrophota bacterium]
MMRINKKGFTLVEIIVAAVLLALISAGIFSVTLSSQKLINRSQRRHFANEVAQAVLENLRSYLGQDQWEINSPIAIRDWECHSFSATGNNLINNITSQFGSSEFATKYGAQWCYRITAGGDNYQYRKAEVNVTWTEQPTSSGTGIGHLINEE